MDHESDEDDIGSNFQPNQIEDSIEEPLKHQQEDDVDIDVEEIVSPHIRKLKGKTNLQNFQIKDNNHLKQFKQQNSIEDSYVDEEDDIILIERHNNQEEQT